jgi:hypothetical protein
MFYAIEVAHGRRKLLGSMFPMVWDTTTNKSDHLCLLRGRFRGTETETNWSRLIMYSLFMPFSGLVRWLRWFPFAMRVKAKC